MLFPGNVLTVILLNGKSMVYIICETTGANYNCSIVINQFVNIRSRKVCIYNNMHQEQIHGFPRSEMKRRLIYTIQTRFFLFVVDSLPSLDLKHCSWCVQSSTPVRALQFVIVKGTRVQLC